MSWRGAIKSPVTRQDICRIGIASQGECGGADRRLCVQVFDVLLREDQGTVGWVGAPDYEGSYDLRPNAADGL